jgi:site-specific recombinase XerD
MATVKIILKINKKNKLNEAPLWIRITQNRKSKYVALGKSIKVEDWDEEEKRVKKSHPNSTRLNKFIAEKMKEAHDVALDLETSDKYVNSSKIKADIKGTGFINFFDYVKRYRIELINEKKYGTIDKLDAVTQKMEKFLGKPVLNLDEITVNWLKNYETHLRCNLKNSTNTIHSNLKIIRRMINEAIREDLFPFERNPFLKYKLKWENTTKEFLEEDELIKLFELKIDSNKKEYHYRNMYIVASEAGGLRISDLLFLQKKNYDGTRILIDTQKTGATVSIKVPIKAKTILDAYIALCENQESFVFPLLSPDLDLNDKQMCLLEKSRATASVNKSLKEIAKAAGIEKSIHFHTSRHTFATRALRKGMRIEYVSKLLGHSNIKTTQIYAKIVNEELDKAMDVFN